MPVVDQLSENVLLLVLILARVGALFGSMPILGTQSVPMQFRALGAIAVSLLILPVCPGTPPEVRTLIDLAAVMLNELVVGTALGVSVALLFSGLQAAGQLAAQTSGMSLSDVYNPATDSNVPIFAQLYDATALGTFLLIGGHRETVAALLDSFQEMPPGRAFFGDDVLDAIVHIVHLSVVTGIRASAPVVVALTMATVIIGLISRTLPQLNAMAMGFGLNALALLVTLGLTIGAAAWAFERETFEALSAVRAALGPPEKTEPPDQSFDARDDDS